VLYEFITSDHKPLSVGFDNIMPMEQSLPPAAQMVNHRTVADCGHVDDVNILHYQSELDVSLRSLNVPSLTVLGRESHTICVALVTIMTILWLV